jgi:hypothetical protein
MASIRDQILRAFVARLAAISADWKAELRDMLNVAGAKVRAVVFAMSEDKAFANTDLYDCTLQVGVHIEVDVVDADDTLDGTGATGSANPFRYLDRMVVLAEKAVHVPDVWDVDPGFTRVLVNGHDVMDPADENSLAAVLRVTFEYRHQVTNPEAS